MNTPEKEVKSDDWFNRYRESEKKYHESKIKIIQITVRHIFDCLPDLWTMRGLGVGRKEVKKFITDEVIGDTSLPEGFTKDELIKLAMINIDNRKRLQLN